MFIFHIYVTLWQPLKKTEIFVWTNTPQFHSHPSSIPQQAPVLVRSPAHHKAIGSWSFGNSWSLNSALRNFMNNCPICHFVMLSGSYRSVNLKAELLFHQTCHVWCFLPSKSNINIFSPASLVREGPAFSVEAVVIGGFHWRECASEWQM